MTVSLRQVDILRIIAEADRANVRYIAQKLGSPTRLKQDLSQLLQKRCIHMEPEGKEHVYKLTKHGVQCLAKSELTGAGSSIKRLCKLGISPKDLANMLYSLKSHVTLTWCGQCGKNSIYDQDFYDACIETCVANMTGTLEEYEQYVKMAERNSWPVITEEYMEQLTKEGWKFVDWPERP